MPSIRLRGVIVGFIIGLVVSSLIYFLLIRDISEIKIEACPECITPIVTPVEKLCPECPKCEICPVCPRCPKCLDRPISLRSME
jgi:hypothetical protein